MFLQCKDLLRKFIHEEYVVVLQEIKRTSGSEAPTACRCVDCYIPDAVMPPGSYRIRVEKRAHADAIFYALPYQPIASLSKVRQTPRGPRGQYGLGKNGQEWFCVPCFEKLLLVHRQRTPREDPEKKFLPNHPIYELAYYILAEEREIVGRPGRLSLCSTKHHGLELWEARYLGSLMAADPSYRPKNTPSRMDSLQFFPSPDGKAVYLQQEDRDYKGKLDDGTQAEISGDQADDSMLKQLLQRLNMRNSTLLAVGYRQNAAAGLVNHHTFPYGHPHDDLEAIEPTQLFRINSRVPVLWISIRRTTILPKRMLEGMTVSGDGRQSQQWQDGRDK